MSSVIDITNKLKQLPQAWLSQLGVVVLLIYIASVVAEISWSVMPSAQGPQNAAVGAGRARDNAGGTSAKGAGYDVRDIVALNVFGAAPAKTEAVIEPQIVDDSPPQTQLNLTLSATVVEGLNRGKGTAIIESAGAQGTYGLGDTIDNTTAVVRQVYVDRVIIQNGRHHETLMLDGVEYDNKNIARPIKSKSPGNSLQRKPGLSRDMSTPTRELRMPGVKKGGLKKEDDKVDNREDQELASALSQQRDDVMNDPTKLAELISFSPVRKEGELIGYKLNAGAQPELFKQAGFEANDLAVEVNGFELNDLHQSLQALEALSSMTEASIVIERDGQRTEILFSLDAANNSNALDKSK